MRYWEIPKLWPNSTVAILGGGPTLIDSLQGVKLGLSKVIAINNAFELGDWIDMCYFGDARWYWWNEDIIRDFKGMLVTSNRNPEKPEMGVERVRGMKIIKTGDDKGICTIPGRINFNSSSGAAAINLAYHLGAKRIVLFGFDMRRVDGKANWKPHPLKKSDKPYDNFIKRFAAIAKLAKVLNLEIWNATPGSLLTDFPVVSKEKLNDCFR